jgi:hypothetical protein
MALIGFENQSEWLSQISNINSTESSIDYFFTQRKVNENEEFIDEKTLERKKKKVTNIYNFLAIVFPISYFKNYEKLFIDIEIWGDHSFQFNGTIEKTNGELPDLMIKLKEDKTMFVKLTFRDNDKLNKIFKQFIPIIKRYQQNED